MKAQDVIDKITATAHKHARLDRPGTPEVLLSVEEYLELVEHFSLSPIPWDVTSDTFMGVRLHIGECP